MYPHTCMVHTHPCLHAHACTHACTRMCARACTHTVIKAQSYQALCLLCWQDPSSSACTPSRSLCVSMRFDMAASMAGSRTLQYEDMALMMVGLSEHVMVLCWRCGLCACGEPCMMFPEVVCGFAAERVLLCCPTSVGIQGAEHQCRPGQLLGEAEI
jgi:hypothetical protein